MGRWVKYLLRVTKNVGKGKNVAVNGTPAVLAGTFSTENRVSRAARNRLE